MIGNIEIKGIIGKDVSLADVISQAKKTDHATGYRVILNSVGGSVNVGKQIYNYLKSLGVPIEMIGTNIVASVSTIVYMAGTTRRIEKGTRFIIHLPRMPQVENATAQDLENYTKELKKIETEVINFYVTNTGITKEGIEPMLKDETNLTEEQLFNMGFITENGSIPIEVVAYLDEQIKPEIMNTEKNKQAKSIVEMISKFLGVNSPEMKMVLTADQKELNFPDLEDGDAIVVGSKATLDGSAVDGNVVMADGRTFVFKLGELIEIMEAKKEESEDVEALKTKITELETKLGASAEKVEAQKLELKSTETKLEESKSVMKKIQGVQSQMIASDLKEKKEKERQSEQDKISDSVNALMDL